MADPAHPSLHPPVIVFCAAAMAAVSGARRPGVGEAPRPPAEAARALIGDMSA